MAEGSRPGEWDSARYEREKRDFIASRRLLRPVALQLGAIFTVTGLAGWLASWALLKLGMTSLPLRHALAFALAYLAFAGCVRLWSDTLRRERARDSGWSWDLPDAPGDPEGWLVVLAVFAVSVLVAGVLTLLGGAPLLLEVAFEVVFAGVVVRRIGRRETLGDWSGRLLRNTWLPALAIALTLVTLAAWLQHEVPAAHTVAQALRALAAR